MKIVCFGEILLRLSPPTPLRLGQTRQLELCFGGAEANVAVSLAGFGLTSELVSRLPENPWGDAALFQLRGAGVETAHLARGEGRMGLYFWENGASQRPGLVIYDRENSAFSRLQPGEIDWETVFSGANWFHFSGITPALGPSVAAATREGVQIAKKRGLVVSCDLNYRPKLWTPAAARPVLRELLQSVDVALGIGESEAEWLFDLRASGDDLLAQIAQIGGFSTVALTRRRAENADFNDLSGALWHEGQTFQSREYAMQIVDRVGGGDAFVAGLIFGLSGQKPPQEALEFAVAASCLKHSIWGDFNAVSLAEVEELAKGADAGRVRR